MYAANRDEVEQMIGWLRRTQLGRLQLAALVMLNLERAGAPPEQWWPAVEPLLRGLERAEFPHFLPAVATYYATVFETLALSPGTARLQACRTVGHPHGPFLQLLTARLERIASARAEAGDDSAKLCRLTARRLLRQWVLDPGPIELRLLAADLLSAELAAASAPLGASELAEQLQRWRQACHAQVAAGGGAVGVGLLGPHPPPQAYAAQNAVVSGLSRISWIAACGCAAAGLALALSPVCLRARRTAGREGWLPWGLGLGLSLVAWGAYYLWTELLNGDPADVVRRLDSAEAGWPAQPLLAAGLTLTLLILVAVAGPTAAIRGSSRRVFAWVVAVASWLVLTLVLLAYTQVELVSLGRYDRECLAALEQQVSAAGPVPEGRVVHEALREWNPAATPAP